MKYGILEDKTDVAVSFESGFLEERDCKSNIFFYRSKCSIKKFLQIKIKYGKSAGVDGVKVLCLNLKVHTQFE
jgi:hypothetical protein